MTYHRIVVKLGTSTLTGGTPNLSFPGLIDVARQVMQLRSEGIQVMLVSSGAIAAGREVLGFPELPRFIPAKQMLAAVGQPRLMALYAELFHYYGGKVAQVLLTKADLTDRRRYLNVRNTLEALLESGVIPIINENDTVAVEEIRLGDNDNLSALVSSIIEADLLLLLTDQKGVFTADPRRDATAELTREVTGDEIPAELWKAAGGSASGLGTGGMLTKLQAADLARRAGAAVQICHGREPEVITRVARGEHLGTYFTPLTSTLESRKRYLLAGIRSTSGGVQVDAGAERSLHHGHSLLPVGIVQVEGTFERGDTIRVLSPSGKQIALGVVNYAAADLVKLCGHKTAEIEEILGYSYGDEAIHRNNMMLL